MMEDFSGILFLVLFGWLVVGGAQRMIRWARDAWRRRRWRADAKRRALSAEFARQKARNQREQDQRRRQWFTLQTAILQLDRCDDYRRAANIAGHLTSLPVGMRQHLFARQRPRLVRHFARRLEAGESERILRSSLASLLSALGIAPFEADYIAREARRLAPQANAQRTGDPALRGQLDHLAREHRQRLAAIAATQGLDPALRENLRQAEIARYQRELFATTQTEAPDAERYLREQIAQRQPAPAPDPEAVSPLADIEAAIRHADGAGRPVRPLPSDGPAPHGFGP